MPTLDLEHQADREILEQRIRDDIDAYCVNKYEHGHRNHLGASEMGKPCIRALYYKFRWMKAPTPSGQLLRLFNVGHQAEPRFIDYLRGIGFEVKEFAEDGKQFRISGANGHYGGSLDGLCKAPAHYDISEDLVFLNEYKTNGTGAGFNKVDDVHLSKAKPEHWAQVCQYGFHYQLKYAIYLIENKNDSSIKVKVVKLDWEYGRQLGIKAEEIVNSKEPPARISDNPAFQTCQWCDDFKGICHNGEVPERNCRSCRMSEPVADARWQCNRHNALIPPEFIPKACPDWTPL